MMLFLFHWKNHAQVENVKRIMTESIKSITGGHSVRVDVELFEGHYVDEDGKEVLKDVLKQINCEGMIPEV